MIIVELDSMKECTRLLSNISNNINQIARRANESGSVYGTDLEDIKTQQDEIWEAHREILKGLGAILEAV